MTSTKTLYASTLALAGLAGGATGWSARPVEVRQVVSWKEQKLADYESAFRVTPEERERLRAILEEVEAEIDALRKEFDRKFGPQVDAVRDRYDARIGAILTPDKRR
jgi:hypothetical protein